MLDLDARSGSHFRRRWRALARQASRLSGWSLSLLIVLIWRSPLAESAEAKPEERTAGDDLFNGEVVPRLELQILPDGMKVLQQYHQVWRQPRPERIDVAVTIREGERVYTNVAVHLKGSFTYQDIDQKPSLTLNFEKFAPGQRFHGLEKISLNNSVQDPSYLSE